MACAQKGLKGEVVRKFEADQKRTSQKGHFQIEEGVSENQIEPALMIRRFRNYP
ncbi:anaerobic ribonucleoside-triphosphate reductase [Sesbania bispinosa]|nr:anaerobic ribonucleoside-triphosphate reductase [Sesbania bispinosa]